MPGKRADRLLVARSLARSRTRARQLIDRGTVTADGIPVRKPSDPLAEDADIRLTEPDHPWVSRGALKLIAALDYFSVAPAGLSCLDLGASTGGFTQVLLARGAARVVAVDVGHDQLDPTIAANPRVLVLEGVNVRNLSADLVGPPPDLITADLSFIGLRTALPTPLALAPAGCWIVALMKPQFEAGRDAVKKGGLVRDPAIHRAVCDSVGQWLIDRGWAVAGVVESPIAGGDGNKEFLIGARFMQRGHG